MPKAFLIDATRCTACRECQTACRERRGHVSLPPRPSGSRRPPSDFAPGDFRLVRFSEHTVQGRPTWYFFPDQCRHCLSPGCLAVATGYSPGCGVRDERTGAVLFNEKTRQLTREQGREVLAACPYRVPRRDEATGLLAKCDMCIDRVQANRLPVCVKACAVGAMNFGERDAMLKLGKERLARLKRQYPKARLLDQDRVAAIYLVADDPGKYHEFAAAQAPEPATRKQFFAKVFAPAHALARS